MMLGIILIFIVSTLILYKSSELIIRSSIAFSKILGISSFVFAFILISVSTSLPELSVAFLSSLEKIPGISVGNVFGANLTVLTFVLGIITIVSNGMSLRGKETKTLLRALIISTLLSLYIIIKGKLTVLYGFVGAIMFVVFSIWMYRSERGHVTRENVPNVVTSFFFSIAALIISAKFVVNSATYISDALNLSKTFVGATLVSLGTTLPELSVELAAVRKKEYALALGDLFGSTVVNITLVLGTLSIMSPMAIDVKPLITLLPFLFGSMLFIWSRFWRTKLRKKDGVLLIIIYVLFLISEVLYH